MQASALQDLVIAAAPSDCCLTGYPHTGTARGTFVSIADINTYIARPPRKEQEKRVILYFPDVWGIDEFQNGQLLCDYFAANGFLVLALDYFQGDSLAAYRKKNPDPNIPVTTLPGFNFEAWKAKHKAFAKLAVPRWIEAVKLQFGAPKVILLLSNPINNTHRHAKHEIRLREAASVTASARQTDHAFPVEARRRAEALLVERAQQLAEADDVKNNEEAKERLKFQFQLFSGVQHGFALRGDMRDAWQRYAKEESAAGIVRWFKMFMD
uniref:Dienelactone hydrolase n=1 Tax=Mycena chlorophos TaxID=658473 RepID=A0ABQ0LT92_MYCCL|nr:dienelactone hydrolase [Mycena chlorophos]